MKTFIQWLRSLSRPSVKDRREQMRIDMFWSFANRYNGTDDCDIAGLFMTAAERARQRLQDDT